MLNKLYMAAALLLALPALADDPYYTTPKTTYDWSTNSSYTTTYGYDGAATVSGSNINTGATWNTTIDKQGNQRGTDADGNLWQYNKATGSYINSNGKVCIGKGATRVCTGDD